MRFQTTLYIPASTPVHACDARVKIVLLFAFTIALLFVESWCGMAVCVAVTFALAAIAQLPPKRLVLLMLPVAFLALFAFAFNVASSVSAGAGAASGIFAGGMVAIRMLLLVLVSFIVCFTSTSTELVDGFASLLRPLRRLRIPVDDGVLVLSMSIRFIPMIAEEYLRIRNAQASRGAPYDVGSLLGRLKAHASVFIPLFVGLFRRADSIALAMDARCYGLASRAGIERTMLQGRVGLTTVDVLVLAIGIGALASIAVMG